jgi:mannan endo-1,4-beta-mannosidase
MECRAHPQTVSVFGPVLQRAPEAAECIFRHPALHFASVHFYESGTIDHPKNTIDAAISTGRLTREALAHVQDTRPFFDSEHGPIHTFKDKKKTLPEPFDDEYFRHMQWAHVASGGAGGGMRWPNRHPHSLTAGMRKAQQALSRFLPLLDWHRFRRINLNNEIQVSNRAFAVFGCGDDAQAVLWLLRTDTVTKTGTLNKKADALSACAHLPGLQPGSYRVTAWDTTAGTVTKAFELTHNGKGPLCVPVPPVQTDLALAITQIRNKEVNAIQQISMGF